MPRLSIASTSALYIGDFTFNSFYCALDRTTTRERQDDGIIGIQRNLQIIGRSVVFGFAFGT